MSRPKLSIIICTYNREFFLEGLFASLKAQTMPKGEFETLLINNNSSDNTEQICLDFMAENSDMDIRYFVESRQGLSHARNRGIEESRGDYLTFADDDALMAPDFGEKICSYLDAHADVGEIGGPIELKFMCSVDWYNPYLASLLGYFVPSKEEYTMSSKNSSYPRGSNMSFRREVFEQCGGFDTSLGRVGRILMGGEEKDIAYRILDAGLKVAYTPSIVVYHLVFEQRTTADFIRSQALGTGISERVRTKNSGDYGRRIAVEAFKWGATLLLWIFYMLQGRSAAANMLIIFRFWVSKGLLSSVAISD